MTTKTELPNCIVVGKKVVRVVAGNIYRAGYEIELRCEGEQIGATRYYNKLNKEFFDDVTACDTVNMFVVNTVTMKRIAEIFLVWGNDGYDVVCDHTSSADRFMPTSEQMDKYESMC